MDSSGPVKEWSLALCQAYVVGIGVGLGIGVATALGCSIAVGSVVGLGRIGVGVTTAAGLAGVACGDGAGLHAEAAIALASTVSRMIEPAGTLTGRTLKNVRRRGIAMLGPMRGRIATSP